MRPSIDSQHVVWIAALFALSMLGCDGSGRISAPPVTAGAPSPPPPLLNGNPVAAIRLLTDTVPMLVGIDQDAVVLAYDSRGRTVSSGLARVSSSNPSVVSIERTYTVVMGDDSEPWSFTKLHLALRLRSQGTSILRAVLGAATDSVVIRVRR